MHLNYKPALPLATFIESLWIYQGQAAPHPRERVLPYGGLSVLVNLADDQFIIPDRYLPSRVERVTGGLVVGPSHEFRVIDTSCPIYIMGVQFRPGGAFPFFRLPISELQRLSLNLTELWPDYARLRENLALAPTAQGKFRVLEETLTAQLDRSLQFHPAVKFLLARLQSGPNPPTLSGLTAQIGLSERRVITLFKQQVGLTPYQFYRVRRFQKLLGRLKPGQPPDWTDLALAAGYFDQAHFIHDFQAFTGVTPTAYLHRASTDQNHIPLPD